MPLVKASPIVAMDREDNKMKLNESKENNQISYRMHCIMAAIYKGFF
jgi:hypothetical protein